MRYTSLGRNGIKTDSRTGRVEYATLLKAWITRPMELGTRPKGASRDRARSRQIVKQHLTVFSEQTLAQGGKAPASESAP